MRTCGRVVPFGIDVVPFGVAAIGVGRIMFIRALVSPWRNVSSTWICPRGLPRVPGHARVQRRVGFYGSEVFLEPLGLLAQGRSLGCGQAFIIMNVQRMAEDDRESASAKGHPHNASGGSFSGQWRERTRIEGNPVEGGILKASLSTLLFSGISTWRNY